MAHFGFLLPVVHLPKTSTWQKNTNTISTLGIIKFLIKDKLQPSRFYFFYAAMCFEMTQMFHLTQRGTTGSCLKGTQAHHLH